MRGECPEIHFMYRVQSSEDDVFVKITVRKSSNQGCQTPYRVHVYRYIIPGLMYCILFCSVFCKNCIMVHNDDGIRVKRYEYHGFFLTSHSQIRTRPDSHPALMD